MTTIPIIDGMVPGMNRTAALERGKAMVRGGRSRREVAIEIYDEYYFEKNVQDSTKSRRLRELVRRLA